MNYKKMRLILIVMLIFTNFIMLVNLVWVSQNDKQIYDKMIQDNILYLENKGIYVDEQTLKKEAISQSVLTYSSISRENIDFIIEDITSSENNLFIGENGTAKINDDGSFAINLTTEHTIESIEELLISAGFDLQSTVIEHSETAIKYTLKIDEILVSNCFFEVILNSNTTTIAGTFVFSNPQVTKSDNSFSVFLTITQICEYYEYTGKIGEISFEYTLSNTNGLQVIPIFRMDTEQNVYYFNIFDNSVTKI